MNNIITKAIAAIEEGKYDRAVGLLEGLLELSGKPNTSITQFPPVTIPSIQIPLPETTISTPNPGDPKTWVTIAGQSPRMPQDKVDQSDAIFSLERAAASKIDTLKTMVKHE